MVNKVQNTGMFGSSAFLKIRHAALAKAATAIKKERFALDEKLDKGQISKQDYQKTLMKLIIKGNNLQNERQEIEDKLNSV